MQGVGLRPLAYCDRGFESPPGVWMFVYCVCCVLSLVQRIPTDCGASLCDHETLWYEAAIARAGLQNQINNLTKYLCTFVKS
jgi:hypothetical protein